MTPSLFIPQPSSLLAIVGPTAGGKTSLSLQIAQRYSGEIICADSRTVYRGMDIGTAKPDKKQQKLARHYCLDMVNPDEPYSAAQFKKDANTAIKNIQSRDKIPVIVGGTGLYINALIYDYKFPEPENTEQRKTLESSTLVDLVSRLKVVDPEAAERVDLANPRRVIRAIETANQPAKMNIDLPLSYLLIGLNPGAEQMNKNIVQRTRMMIKNGLVEESLKLAETYGGNIEPLNTVGYREVLKFAGGELSSVQMEEQIIIKTRQLAKKQMTWFKRDKNIGWFTDTESAMNAVELELGRLKIKD